MSLRIVNSELRMAHEVVDGAARLGGLQTFVGRHTVSEGIDNTNLKDKGKLSVLGVTGEQRGRFWSSLFWVLSQTNVVFPQFVGLVV